MEYIINSYFTNKNNKNGSSMKDYLDILKEGMD